MTAEEALIKKAKKGDLVAYGQLVERHQDQVYNLSLKMLGTPEDAKDASQDIFISVYKALPGFQGESVFSTWLYRITSNKCLDILRKKKRDLNRNYSLGEGGLYLELPDPESGPEEMFLIREKQETLKKAVADLPEPYRLALVLHHYQDLSYREVAQIMGLSDKTVATRLHRAKRILREKLLEGDPSELQKGKGKADRLSGRGMSAL